MKQKRGTSHLVHHESGRVRLFVWLSFPGNYPVTHPYYSGCRGAGSSSAGDNYLSPRPASRILDSVSVPHLPGDPLLSYLIIHVSGSVPPHRCCKWRDRKSRLVSRIPHSGTEPPPGRPSMAAARYRRMGDGVGQPLPYPVHQFYPHQRAKSLDSSIAGSLSLTPIIIPTVEIPFGNVQIWGNYLARYV